MSSLKHSSIKGGNEMDFTWLNGVISATQGVLDVLSTPPLSYFVSMIVLGAMIKIIMDIIRPEKGG